MFKRCVLIAGLLFLMSASFAMAKPSLRALIVDGQNNHGIWPKTTKMMKRYLEDSGLFSVDVATTKPKGTDPDFAPDFSKYNVVVSNYNGAPWPEATRKSFVDYVKDGGGFVVIHAANNAFGNWKEYNEIIGLGGWGGRNERSGPYVYLSEAGKVIRDTSKGGGGHHGPQHPFAVIVRDGKHPITKGMPDHWLHAKDELYDKLRGPGENMQVLATAYADPNKGGSGRHEPMIMTLSYGKGRVFHTPMGHADYSQECVGFITTFLRGTEWAASGKVTQEIPKDFPSADEVSVRSFAVADPPAGSGPAKQWVVYEGKSDPGAGKHIVLVAGDQEYRSEEAMPQLGKILAVHHGFKCTVLFPMDDNGIINPNNTRNIPGLEALKTADLMIMSLRFRDLHDAQMKHIDDYLKSGRPVIGMRTSTHAFNMGGNKPYARYSNGYGGKEEAWKDGFGRLVLGEKWISHHGGHHSQSTRGIIAEGAKDHPIVRGIKNGDVWGPTDVYGVRLPLPKGCQPLVLGQVLKGMKPGDEPLEGPKNDPMMPVGWTKPFQLPGGKAGQAFTTTMGSSNDLVAEGTRRMLVNAAYWCVGLADKIPMDGTKVDCVGKFSPSDYGFKRGDYWPKKGLKPSDFEL